MKKINRINQYLSITLLVFLGVFLLAAFSIYLRAILGAIILYVLFKPVMNWLLEKRKWKSSLAAVSILLTSFCLVIVPSLFIGYLLADKAGTMLENKQVYIDLVKRFAVFISSYIKIDLFSIENLQSIQGILASYFSGFLGEFLSTLANLAIMYFLLFYMLISSQKMEHIVFSYLPYNKENTRLFQKELEGQVFSNVLGAPLLAIIQGIFAIGCFWLVDLPDPVFWGMICGFFSFIPLVGTALVWAPAGLYLLTLGTYWQGIVVLIYGALVISNIDNVFRFVLQKKFADVHPVITVMGVIIGLNWFGIVGIIYGPLLISFFLIMVKIFRMEFLKNSVTLEESNDPTLSEKIQE